MKTMKRAILITLLAPAMALADGQFDDEPQGYCGGYDVASPKTALEFQLCDIVRLEADAHLDAQAEADDLHGEIDRLTIEVEVRDRLLDRLFRRRDLPARVKAVIRKARR